MFGQVFIQIISALLFFVLFFGIGFILNMLIKTTWMPVYLYLIAVVPWAFWHFWEKDLGIGENLLDFTYVGMGSLLAGIGGAYVSGWAIRALRRGGYKMF